MRRFIPLVFISLLSMHIATAQRQPGIQITAQQRQPTDRLALQHLELKEYDKANVYLEDLYDKNPDAWFQYYLRGLMGAKEFTRAEKIVKREIKRNRQEAAYHVLLARIYREQQEDKNAREELERAVKEFIPSQPFIANLAQALKDDRQYEYVLKVYDRASAANPDYPFFYERAEVYKAMNDLRGMVNEYLDALDFRESELLNVRTQLQNSLGYDDENGGMKNPVLREELQKRIQKSPEKIVYADLLIFILTQQNDFQGAFVHARALDKRLKEDGQRIYELAQLCVANEDWEAARRCYGYLAEKGPNSSYHDLAQIEGAHVDFLAVTQKPQPAKDELLLLAARLEKILAGYRDMHISGTILKDLANLYAYYLGEHEKSIGLLESAIAKAGQEATVRAGYKLMLADVYLISGEIWEASLLYSQVEKDFKYEAIGQDAKFRNARLSYYAGDFKWAKAQADILKGATTKLIANDALDLSIVISDAIGVDTNDIPLKLFASAELMALQHRYDDAINRLDSINLLFSTHTLGDDIFYRKASIYSQQGKYTEAESMYKNVLEYYPTDIYGDDSQFKLAALYELKLKDIPKAQEAYKELLIRYPGSIFSVEARKKYRQLRGDDLNN